MMEDAKSVASLLESTTSKIQQLQRAFAELESQRAVTLNMKWKQIEDHFHGLEKSLKRRFTELEDQEKEFEIKTTQSRQLLEKRQAAVIAKEEASLERLQEKRDAAAANVLNKRRNGISETDLTVEDKPPDDIAKLSDSDVKALSNPQLAKLCEENDAQGLHKFISDNRKNLSTIKEELPIALKAAAKPGGLVLDSLSGFYMSSEDGKKDSNHLGQRRTCIMLMECLSILLTNLGEKSLSKVISKDVKERAKVIAFEWKPKLDDLDVDASNGNSLEAHAFLQLVATFGINSDFVQEDLSKLIPMVSRRHQVADLCHFLGLSDKMPGVIDVLVSSGRHIDAVNLAFAFELTELFSPVSVLKSYLTEARRVPSAIKSANLSPTAQNDVSERELSALKAVIKCIEDHKLEDDRKTSTQKTPSQWHSNRNTNIAADKNNFYGRMTDNRYALPTPYMYNRSYGYPGPVETHIPQYMGTAAYNMGPNNSHYFAIGYSTKLLICIKAVGYG
ncbi:hypothetical protein E3N88_35662 [Mikania micrantha]|uniref:FRIGIDA-like protein n=1 Tax=Mikania micrantha TaxID=192012 RepID=A0A5N6M1Y1_9ASTR|nr:hypothetical protein E3N88_35662 [Mikania micrantha]